MSTDADLGPLRSGRIGAVRIASAKIRWRLPSELTRGLRDAFAPGVPLPERRQPITRWLLDLVSGDQLPGDDDALQFVGALADNEERGIAVEAFDGEFLGITVAAMDAHRFEADIHRCL